MKTRIIMLIILICQIPIYGEVMAQDHLQIKKVFDTYGKQEGSVMVQLSKDILSQGSRITFYKSLITNQDVPKLQLIIEALETDIKNGSKLSELKKDGNIESAIYVLSATPKGDEYEYILYKVKSKKITLVYLKGKFPPNELDRELGKLKDLFIVVNNKRLKLQ